MLAFGAPDCFSYKLTTTQRKGLELRLLRFLESETKENGRGVCDGWYIFIATESDVYRSAISINEGDPTAYIDPMSEIALYISEILGSRMDFDLPDLPRAHLDIPDYDLSLESDDSLGAPREDLNN